MADGFHIPKISLIVISRNEEELIGQCLESAASFCDEMIVVDSFSTDRTVEIARTLGARVFEREFQGYIAQKQFAFEQARGEWIFSLDADEHATWELGREISVLSIRPARRMAIVFAGFSIIWTITTPAEPIAIGLLDFAAGNEAPLADSNRMPR